MKDYAPQRAGQARKVSSLEWRQKSRALRPGSPTLLWRLLGGMLVLAMVTGIISSFWLGHCIQRSLSGIAHAQEAKGVQEQVRSDLLQEKAMILTSQRLEARAAVQVNLFSPRKGQRVGL